MAGELSSFTKLPKLNKPADYIQWKRRLYAFIRREDSSLISLTAKPSDEAEVAEWMEKSTKAKSTIILCLGDAVLAKTRAIVDDDDKSAKDLWYELKRMFTTSSQQEITNLVNRLNTLTFNENRLWDSHVSEFMSIVDELASYDQAVSDEEKKSKLIRSLPRSFEPLAIVSSMTEMSFDQLISAVQAEIARRQGQNSLVRMVPDNPPPQARFAGRHDTFRGRGRGYFSNYRGRGGFRGGRGFRGRGRGFPTGHDASRVCHYCGMPGHFIKHCRTRLAVEGEGRIHKPGYHRQAREQGGGHMPNWTYGANRQGTQAWNGGDFSNSAPPWGGSSGAGPSSASQPAPFGANAVFGPPEPPLGPPRDSNQGPQARMAKLKFSSKVANISQKKDKDAFIDSGATHNFFHSRSSFTTYEAIDPEVVYAAYGETTLIGKGTVHIPIGNGISQEAYHAPGFSSNIIAVNLISENFEVLMSSTHSDRKECILFVKGSLRSEDIVWKTDCEEGLYKIKFPESIGFSRPSANSAASLHSFAEWHEKTGHISSRRYQDLSSRFDGIPVFPKSITDSFECTSCLRAKMRKAPVPGNSTERSAPYEEVHYDISGPHPESLGGNSYAAHFIEPRTAKSDVFFLKSKSDLTDVVIQYIAKVESHFSQYGYRIRRLRCDNAGENLTNELRAYCVNSGIDIKTSPAHAPESNGLVERLVQEHWTRARVLMFSTDLPTSTWADALFHSNWLRNRLPCSQIDGDIPILRWDPKTEIKFSSLLKFGQQGFSFIYRPSTIAQRKLLPRSEFSRFLTVESVSRLIRVLLPSSNRIRVVRRADFHPTSTNQLPPMSSFLDGISRFASLEAEEQAEDGVAEEDLSRCLTSTFIPHKNHLGISDGPPLPTSFEEACRNPNWATAIDREYEALIRRGTWTYQERTATMKPVPCKWTFRAKQLDDSGNQFLYKARCVLRGDMQKPFEDYDPEGLYAPVASHETLRMFFSVVAAKNLILEGADVNNAYLYSPLDVPLIMEQPTNSSQQLAYPNCVCVLRMSLYGARQAGMLWGTVLDSDLKSWGFAVSTFDARLYFKSSASSFIIVVIVVDDMAFAASNRDVLDWFKSKLRQTFDVKHYGNLRNFIGWSINSTSHGIHLHQSAYAKRLLQRFGLSSSNAVLTPMATPLLTHPREPPFSPNLHRHYRSLVGGVSYLAVSTRPDLSYPVSVLSRNLHNPTRHHLNMARRLLRYIAGTTHYSLFYAVNHHISVTDMCAAVDADWGGDPETRRSTTGYIIVVNGSPTYWRSKRQTVLSLSSGEAEYVALSTCATAVTWLRKLMWELLHCTPWTDSATLQPTPVFSDSTVALKLAGSPQASTRTKHISMKIHHVRELVSQRVISLHYVRSSDQPADVLTKPSTRHGLEFFFKTVNMNVLAPLTD